MTRIERVGDQIVKTVERPPPGLFAAEARGLARLRQAGARVPRVDRAGPTEIVMEWVGEGPEDWEGLASQIARLHLDRRGSYGSAEPLFIGRFPLPAGEGDWLEVYRELRVRPLLRACRGTLGTLARRGERVGGERERPRAGPALVHGDLWHGNVLFGADGPALIDPSTQRAERGLDLAMMELFGGFPAAFWRAYEALWPIPGEVRAALPAYRLYYLLVHVHFFGRSYLPGVAEIVAG